MSTLTTNLKLIKPAMADTVSTSIPNLGTDMDSIDAEFALFGTTANRPTTNNYVGRKYFDTTIGRMVEWDGTIWRQFDGAPVQTKNISYAAAVPTSGTVNQNDLTWHTASVAGGNIGWVAVRTGQLATGWLASTAYVLNAFVVPTADNAHVYKCTTAGTSAATQPTWPTGAGLTVTDGTVVWTEAGTAGLMKTFGAISA